MLLNRSKSRNISTHRHQEKLTSVINNKKIRSHLNKIISEFSILPKKLEPLIVVKHVAKTLFWSTVYLAFSYLTITWSFEVIQQFRDDQTTTNMKAIINNNVTYLPNMTICLKINTTELFSISSPSSFNYTSAWSRFFNETISPEDIFEVNESQIYDDEIYLSLLKYLAMIYEAERACEPGLTQISTFHSDKSDDWIALRKVLVPNIERFNITLEQLKSVFDGKFCSMPMYVVGYDSLLVFKQSGKTECIAGSKISFIGMDTICFRLIGYQNYLQQLGTTENIFLNPYYGGEYSQKWCQEITIDLGSESRSTPRRATTRNETFAYYYNRFTCGERITMDIGVKALYRKLPYVKGDVQCSSDTSREECENKCLRGWIRTNCHCSPITFNLTTATFSYRNCTVDDYSNCLEQYAENATSLCSNKCVPLCEQWHYEYNFGSDIQTSFSTVQIGTKTFDFLIIEQVFTWPSFEEFIGAFGGGIGLWLGLDFVIIIEFIVSLLTNLIKKILLRNVHNSEEDKHEESVNIKHSEENVENRISSSHDKGSHISENQIKGKEVEIEIDATSIRLMNESEKQTTSRKNRESIACEEKHKHQRRQHANNNRMDKAITNKKIKNSNVHDRRLRNHQVNVIDSVDAVQEESTAQANNSSGQKYILQKLLFLFLNGDTPTNTSAMFLRIAEKLFWATIYIVGSVFTAVWCVELINLYLADEAVYYPSLITDGTVSLQPPSLCIDYDSRYIFQGYDNITIPLRDYFNKSNITRASLIKISGGNDWPEQLVSIGLLYLGVLAGSEANYTEVSFISDYEWRLKLSAGEDFLLKNDINESLNGIFLPKILEWNITANELRQKLGVELARMIELKISFTNSNGTTNIVNKTSFYTAAITDEIFCYGLSYGVIFTTPDDVLEFSVNSASYPHFQSLSSFGYIHFSDYLLEPKSVQLMNLNSYLTVYDSTFFPFEYGYVTKTSISVDGLYTSRPKTDRVKLHCSPFATKLYCRAQCRIELIENLCNCSPAYWAMMIPPTSGLDECTFDRYMGCLNYNTSDDIDCKDLCLPFCTASYFRSNSYRDELHPKYYHTAVIKFSVNNGVYMSIVEQPTFTFIDLLIKLGGTLGILLGFNIFSFYRVIITAATLCLAFILKRTRFAQSPLLLKSLDKINKSKVAKLISELNRQLRVMNVCDIMKTIKINDIWKNIFLSIGYLIGLYVTVRMGSALFSSFKVGEPKYLVDLMMNDTIKLPSSTICMPLYAVELLNETEIWQFESNTNLTRNLYLNSFYDKKKLFSESWPTWLIQWTYEYLIIYDTVERHGTQKFISALPRDSDSAASCESTTAISKYNFTSLVELDELIDHLNITIPELKQNLGQKIRDSYKITAVYVKEDGGVRNDTVLNITDTTFIGEDKVCYKLPLDTVTFSSKSDYFFILIDRGSLLPNPQDCSYLKPLTIDFSGRDVSQEESKYNSLFGSTQSFFFHKTFSAKLDMSRIFEAMPVSSGIRHCSESKSMETCQDECQQKKIERFCKCSPALWSNTNLTRCHLIDYKRCASLLASSDVDICELNCIPHCTRISFEDKLSGSDESIDIKVAEINFTINSFEYLSFKEVNKYTMTNFINEFGGILGLWIGLDFLAFVDLFYWLVCKYCHILRQFLGRRFQG